MRKYLDRRVEYGTESWKKATQSAHGYIRYSSIQRWLMKCWNVQIAAKWKYCNNTNGLRFTCVAAQHVGYLPQPLSLAHSFEGALILTYTAFILAGPHAQILK